MQHLITKAQDVLNNNARPKGFTIPCEGLYPFQWFWDSGFIAIGLAHFNMDRAKREITSLLSGQWQNGFIPHIVFHNNSDTYFPGPDYHQSYLHPQASKTHKTSGITQPPVTGFALKALYDIAKDKTEILNFIKTTIDKVYHNHHYFYTQRDPNNEGLVYIYHNWESGTDNSPVWDAIWKTIDPPKYKYKRRDTNHVDAAQRPTNREYDCYIHLIEIAKQHNYNDAKIAELSPFLVQDPLFNAMLIKSNEALITLYRLIENSEEKIAQLSQWQEKAIAQFNHKLFNEKLGAYVHFNLRENQQIAHLTSSSFTPLFAGIPDDNRAEKMVNSLMTNFGGKDHYLCASFNPKDEKFDPKKYWRGPIWINLNWIIYKGLLRYNFKDEAKRVKEDTIALIKCHGFHEYFDPRKSITDANYGGNNFSWTAALLIDILKS